MPHASFSTALGTCALAWDSGVITAISILPPPDRFPGDPETPPPWVQEVINLLVHHLAGDIVDLSTIPLDLDRVPPFHRRVYEVARAIGRAEVRTYGEIAAAAGSPSATRAVGQAMAHNPFPIVVPCHRVIARGHKPGGFSAPGGLDTKARLLAIEGRDGFSPQLSLALGEPPR